MNRSKQTTVAAVLAAIMGILSIADGARILAAGSAGLPAQSGMESVGGPPFWAGLMFFAMGVAFLFSAYGVWKNQRWGKIVAIILSAINGLFMLGDIIGALSRQIYTLTAVFIVGELVLITIIVLLLQRTPGQSRA